MQTNKDLNKPNFGFYMKKKILPVNESLFVKSVRIARSNQPKSWLIVLFDLLFIVAAFSVYTLNAYFAESLFLPTSAVTFAIYIAFSLLYWLAILFAYTFFKYLVLNSIKSYFEPTEISFSRLGKFYYLNLVLAVAAFAFILLLNLILASIQIQYRPIAFVVIAAPLGALAYVFVGMSHSFFSNGKSVKDSLRGSMSAAFSRINVYGNTVIVMLMYAMLLWLVLLAAGYLIRLLATGNYSTYLAVYAHFQNFSKIAFDILAYFFIFVNRITFFELAKKDK